MTNKSSHKKKTHAIVIYSSINIITLNIDENLTHQLES
jgi:hypothetical protein